MKIRVRYVNIVYLIGLVFLPIRRIDGVYRKFLETTLENLDELRNQIITKSNSVRNNSDVFERVQQSMMRRLNGYIQAAGGSHFEHWWQIDKSYLYFLTIKCFYCLKFCSRCIFETKRVLKNHFRTKCSQNRNFCRMFTKLPVQYLSL